MPPAPRLTGLQKRSLDFVKTACDDRAAAQARFEEADQEFRRRIVAAQNLGCSLDQIAAAAGISKTRAHQIVRGQ